MTLELSIEQCLCLPSKVKYASECLIIVQIAGTFGLAVAEIQFESRRPV